MTNIKAQVKAKLRHKFTNCTKMTNNTWMDGIVKFYQLFERLCFQLEKSILNIDFHLSEGSWGCPRWIFFQLKTFLVLKPSQSCSKQSSFLDPSLLQSSLSLSCSLFFHLPFPLSLLTFFSRSPLSHLLSPLPEFFGDEVSNDHCQADNHRKEEDKSQKSNGSDVGHECKIRLWIGAAEKKTTFRKITIN